MVLQLLVPTSYLTSSVNSGGRSTGSIEVNSTTYPWRLQQNKEKTLLDGITKLLANLSTVNVQKIIIIISRIVHEWEPLRVVKERGTGEQ
jgi:hypothetical protein